MFFKRRPAAEPAESSSEVVTIPEIFYGGGNPENQGGVSSQKSSVAMSASAAGATVSPGRTRLIAGVMITVFVIVLAGAGWYFWGYLGLGGNSDSLIPPPAPSVAPAIPSAPTTSAGIPEAPTVPETADNASVTSTPVIIATTTATTTPAAPVPVATLEFPAIIQIDSPDLDADGLTDAEEEVFTTDPSIFDTDADNYQDGLEVLNLYNPKGTAPVQIIDSGLVKDLVHAKNIYRIYYPLAWQVGLVDLAGDTTLITAANGDYIEYRIVPKIFGEDFTSWFARVANNERITDLQNSVNRFGTAYWHRRDDLVAYVDKPDFVLAIIYHPQSNAPIAFRHVMQMMLASLRLEGITSNPAP